MCGRFTLTSQPGQVASAFDLAEMPQLRPRYNIAPGQDAGVVRVSPEGDRRVLEPLRWGLVPSWAKDPRPRHRMINARAETAAKRPAYRAAFRKRRCIVPADGFYEWAPGRPHKQPYYIQCREGAPFAMAGLWERWSGPDAQVLESFAVLTTPANHRLRAIHERMPAILEPGAFDLWLDPGVQDVSRLEPLLRPCPDAWIALRTVSTRVNDVSRDDPACVAPAAALPSTPSLF